MFRAAVCFMCMLLSVSAFAQEPQLSLLTDPFLQLPAEDSVHVVWFTEFEGDQHEVVIGEQVFTAQTTKLSRMFEDAKSRVGDQIEDAQVYQTVTERLIYRHEAQVTGLSAGERQSYFVRSSNNGEVVESDTFTLAPLPASGQPLKILLTSDHQLKPMTSANLQKVAENIGVLDAVFLSGDLVNVPDRASEWFDDNRGLGFFPALQGRTSYALTRTMESEGRSVSSTVTYQGGEIIQHAPLFPVIGNHEVMGRYNPATTTSEQFNDPQPRAVAEARYEALADIINPEGDDAIKAQWIQDNSFNTITYEELFTLPDNGPAGEQYYAVQFGDVYMIGLYATRIWRTPSMNDDARGKYREPQTALNTPDNWGYGDFIFEDLAMGSEQYNWLQEQLNSDAFKQSPYKVVLMHQGPHGLGENYNPVFAHPEQIIDYDANGRIEAVRYEYPLASDILVRDIEPLFNDAGVQLVHMGHSHLWFHIKNPAGVHYLETSNVGNSYGCYVAGYKERSNIPNDPRFNSSDYVTTGDPHGLPAVMPSEGALLQDAAGNDVPCLDSNEMTAFSILDTASASVKSYVFDARNPDSDLLLFDEFSLVND